MKKIGLLLLALVIALGALGVGYAKWTDTVTINGTVNTGTLKIGINDQGTNDPRIEDEISLDPLCPPEPGVALPNERKDVAWMNSYRAPKPNELICEIDGVKYYETIIEEIGNAYPGYAPSTTIKIASCGTVPLKIEDIQLTNPTGTDLTPWMKFSWSVTDEDGNTFGTYSGNIQALEKALLGQQIAGGKTISFTVQICFQEYACVNDVQVLMPENANMGFSLVFTGSQWNEVAATPVYPSN